ncbi:uncharacterized protein LOC111609440 [Xiphophorus maculatus]|uniref:uncharacterized protein LOC111609440 n=1 Tax=Xiphophorus maculatus TaxID=8083 RepID=UPI000C6EBF23|nr:uncharacterized protein LOC111609440 [Xiphophorus maculatus]XP_027876208.1 uncharacterized protein LOC114146409 [Xiphophorus couchianus]
MKILFMLFCLLQENCLLKAQPRTEEVQPIVLRLVFPPFYNGYNKSCCKLYPGQCYKVLDSAGYTCDSLRGRVTTTEEDGWIEFRISNVQVGDAGYYRCAVLGIQNHIYSDHYVEVFETSDHYSKSQFPLTTPAIRVPSSFTTLLASTVLVPVQDFRDNDRASWNFRMLLFVTVSITAMISVVSVVVAVCCKVKAKRKKSNVHGEALCESQKRDAPEMSGIVYAIVDFKPRQKPEGVYANLEEQRTGESISQADNAGTVEYSTLAIQL